MKFKKQIVIESAVGLFSFAVLGALFLLTVVLSRDAFLKKASPVEIVFEDVMGLRVGDSVNSRGVVVGKVQAMELAADGVHVHATLTRPVELRSDYKVEVLSTSVLGGRYLNLHTGSTAGEVIAMPKTLKGSPSADLIDSATRAVEDIRAALNDGVLEDFKATMSNIRAITERLNGGEGTLARLLNDGTVYEDVQVLTANLRKVSDGLASGEGTLGRLLTDETLYADAQAVAADFKTISGRLAAGEGTLGRLLMSDDAVYEDLASTMKSLRGMSEGLAAGEGTLGKLLTEEEMYLELKALLREGRAAIDDMRETSPITTFSSIFFGAF